MDAEHIHKQLSGGPVNRRVARLNRQVATVNWFGRAGYFFLAIEWLFVFALYFTWIYTYLIVPLQPTGQPVAPKQPPQTESMFAGELPLWGVLLLGAFVFCMVALSVYALIKTPRMIADAGSATAKSVATQTVPLILKAQHKAPTKKNRLRIHARILVYIKLALVLLPLFLAVLTQYLVERVMPVDYAIWGASLLSFIPLFFFVVQYALATLFRVRHEQVV